MNLPRCFFAFGCCATLAFANGLSAADLTTLMERSPFSPAGAAGSSADAAEPVSTLEFRGMAVETQGVFFSVFDAAANRGYWLCEGKPHGPMRVTRYDAESCVLEIEQNGRALKLFLKQAATATAATPPVLTAAAVASAPGWRVRTPGVQPPANESERIAQIAKMVRDRRAARLAARSTASGNTTMPATSPGL